MLSTHRRSGALAVLQVLPPQGVLRLERHSEPRAQSDGRQEHPRHGHGRRRKQHAVSQPAAAVRTGPMQSCHWARCIRGPGAGLQCSVVWRSLDVLRGGEDVREGAAIWPRAGVFS